MKKRIFVVDGNSLAHRAYHGIRPLVTKEGIYTHAIYGFLKMVLGLMEKEKPDGLCVAFDIGKTFRHELYSEYKGGRKKTDEELKMQFPYLREILTLMGVRVLTLENYEADDIIGTIAAKGSLAKDEIKVISGDKDTFQLIDENVSVYMTKKGLSEIEVLTPKNLKELYGFEPCQVRDIKGLQGDASDNIKGVQGIGEKTAKKLIEDYGSLEGIYEHIDELKGKVKENLIEFKDNAFFSRDLATIRCDLDIPYGDFKVHNTSEENVKLKELLEKLELKSFYDLVRKEDIKEAEAGKYIEGKVFKNFKKFVEAVSKMEGSEYFLDYGINEEFLLEKIRVFDSIVQYNFSGPLTLEEGKEFLTAVINKKGKLVLHDSKKTFRILLNYGLDLNIEDYEDLYLENFVLFPDRSDKGDKIYEDFFGDNLDYEIFPQYMKIIYDVFKNKLKNSPLLKVYETQDKPLTKILANMEHIGVKVSKKELKKMKVELTKRLEVLRGDILSYVDEEFNINSPKQLGEVLFEKLDFKKGKKTKSGYSTNQEVLTKLLVSEHPKNGMIVSILEYRKLSKILSTYVDGLIDLMDSDGIIHTTYNQTVAVTGRLSSENPNLQNIPIRFEEGKKIRKAFEARGKGRKLLCGDYSQIELRVLAHISGDENMIQAFRRRDDIHALTASKVFGVNLEKVTPEMRRKAKAVNFGVVYGISDYGLSKELNISLKEAKDFIDKFFNEYPKIRKWIDKTLIKARETYEVTTMTGRRRKILELGSSNYMVRSSGERMAMNTPIQGSAADLLKIAMINIFKRFENEKVESKIIMQVHDELIFEVVEKELKNVISIVTEEMERSLDLDVPLEVDFKIGDNWYEMESI